MQVLEVETLERSVELERGLFKVVVRHRGVVPLAESSCRVAIVAEHLGHVGRRLRDAPGVTVSVVGKLGDLPCAHTVVVPTR